MSSKTEAVVLRIVKYSDKASIVTLYTREYGTVPYIVYGLGSKRSAVRSSAFLPLSIIEITASHNPNREVQQMKEAKPAVPLTDIYCNPFKNAIALFVAELLFKSLKHTETDVLLFDFIKESILELENSTEEIANFHLIFMAKLSNYLGFNPNMERDDACYFDLMNGVFTDVQPMHEHFLDKRLTTIFSSLLDADFQGTNDLGMSRTTRNLILDALVQYYKLHVPGFGGLKSLDVLRELFI